MSILTPTKLETMDYRNPLWQAIYNTNIERLNAALLKVRALLDVDIDTIEDGAVLMWNATKLKWVPVKYD